MWKIGSGGEKICYNDKVIVETNVYFFILKWNLQKLQIVFKFRSESKINLDKDFKNL